jgi:hypothetical protein
MYFGVSQAGNPHEFRIPRGWAMLGLALTSWISVALLLAAVSLLIGA